MSCCEFVFCFERHTDLDWKSAEMTGDDHAECKCYDAGERFCVERTVALEADIGIKTLCW